MGEKKSKKNPVARRKMFTHWGFAIIVLAAVGLVSLIGHASGFIKGLMDDSAKFRQYEELILPVVMVDPVPFEEVQNIDENSILQASLWSALLSENRTNYSYDENEMMLVPSSDLDVAAKRLFGPEASLVHQSFDDMGAMYLYDPEIGAYRVPMVAKLAYSPKVVREERFENTIKLTVGYIAPGNILTNVERQKEKGPEPEKYMLYLLKKYDNAYYIAAIQDTQGMAVS